VCRACGSASTCSREVCQYSVLAQHLLIQVSFVCHCQVLNRYMHQLTVPVNNNQTSRSCILALIMCCSSSWWRQSHINHFAPASSVGCGLASACNQETRAFCSTLKPRWVTRHRIYCTAHVLLQHTQAQVGHKCKHTVLAQHTQEQVGHKSKLFLF
jgi:hypothetical protein